MKNIIIIILVLALTPIIKAQHLGKILDMGKERLELKKNKDSSNLSIKEKIFVRINKANQQTKIKKIIGLENFNEKQKFALLRGNVITTKDSGNYGFYFIVWEKKYIIQGGKLSSNITIIKTERNMLLPLVIIMFLLIISATSYVLHENKLKWGFTSVLIFFSILIFFMFSKLSFSYDKLYLTIGYSEWNFTGPIIILIIGILVGIIGIFAYKKLLTIKSFLLFYPLLYAVALAPQINTLEKIKKGPWSSEFVIIWIQIISFIVLIILLKQINNYFFNKPKALD